MKYIFFLLTVILVSCNNGSWSYKTQDKWGIKFKNCAGHNQAPVNIITSQTEADSTLTPLFIDYLPADTFRLTLDKHWLRLSGIAGSVTVPDTAYWGHMFYLSKVIFHVPSEIEVNGKHFPAEVQFIHQDTSGKYMVISVLMKQGQVNPAMELILDKARKGKTVTVDTVLDLNFLLPYNVHYWHFRGSLSYPPCTPDVAWFVMAEPVEVAPAQLERLKFLLKEPNIRKIQPLGNRIITRF